MNEKKPITALEIVWQNVWIRAVTYVILTSFIIYALWQLRTGYAFALQVGIIGFVIAYILNPVVKAMERIRIRRSIGVVIIYVILLQLLVLGSVLVSQVVIQLGDFAGQIPRALDNISSLTANVATYFQNLSRNFTETLPAVLSDRFGIQTTGDDLSLEFQQQLEVFLSRATEALRGALERIVTDGPGFLVSGATNIISATLQVFLILLASAYFLYDYPKFIANFQRYIPVRWRPLANDIGQKADNAIGGYLRGQLLITSLLGVFIWIGLSIIGVPLALAISFLAAIFNLVPYLGPIIGVIPAVLLGFTVSPLAAVLAILVFIIANQIEGNVLSPLILSKSTNLHPVTVLLTIMAGLGLFGFVGALLAVPIVALIKVILEEYLLQRPAYQMPAPVVVTDSPEPDSNNS